MCQCSAVDARDLSILEVSIHDRSWKQPHGGPGVIAKSTLALLPRLQLMLRTKPGIQQGLNKE